MSLYMYDAAYEPDLAKVKAKGGIAVNGYLTGQYEHSTTSPADARADGLGWVATYEEGPSELVRATREQGQAVGKKILNALKAHGVPLDGSIAVYPSVDVAVGSAEAWECNKAWRGMRDILEGKVSLRAYAEGAVIDALFAAGLVDGPCWLAAPTSWPGYDVNDEHVGIIQLVGTDVTSTDKNHLIVQPHAIGAWWPDGSPYAEQELVMDAASKTRFDALDNEVAGVKADVAALDHLIRAIFTVKGVGQVSADTIVARRLGPFSKFTAAVKKKLGLK